MMMQGLLRNSYPIRHRRVQRRSFVALLGLLVALTTGVAWAQSDTARLVGTILDASGAVIPGATIQVTSLDTGRSITVNSGDAGEFTVNALQAGRYHVEVSQNGFKSDTADITLEVSQVRELELKLEPGSAAVTVNVTADVPLIDTTTSSTGEVIQGRQVTELPLNGRNFSQLALLTPGVTRGAYGDISSGGTSGNAAESFRNSDTGGAALAVNGLRPQANNFILDGVDNNEALVGSIVFFPPAEAIEEFRVNTSVAPAEFGRAGGAIIQTRIKSGSNAYHGSAFWFRRDQNLDARPYGVTGPNPTFLRNQFGGTVGGAMWANKLFGFGDYQGLRQKQPQGVEFASVPTDLMRKGDFSELLGTTLPSVPGCVPRAAGQTPFDGKGYIFDPTTCLPFGWNGTVGTNVIPNGNPVGLKYLQGYPEPNLTGTIENNFKAQRKQLRQFNDFDLRFDFNPSQKDQVFFRYSYGEDNFTVTNRLGPNNPSGFGSGDNINHPRGYAAGYTRTFSDKIINEFRFGYLDTTYGYNPPNIGQTLAKNIGIPGANPTGLLGGQALIGGNNTELEYQGDGGPYNVPQKLYQFLDAVSYNHGNHAFKFGFSVGKRHVDFVQGNNAKGYFIIGGHNYPGTGRFTGYEVSELLAGFVDYSIGQFQGLYQTRNYETGYFAQDDWRVSRRLTLNLGIRYDLYTWPYEEHNRQSSFDLATGKLLEAGTSGNSRSLIDTDYSNFAPRLGFAYDLTGNGKSVLHGGYGIFYFLDRGGVGNQLSQNPEFNGTSSYQACIGSTTQPWAGGEDCTNPAGFRVTLSGVGPQGNDNWNAATASLPTPVNNVDINNPKNVNVIDYPKNSKVPRVQQWNVQFQRTLGSATAASIAYVGTKQDHLATPYNANNPPLGGGPVLFPSLNGNVNVYAFIGSGRYDGLQTSLTRQMRNGMQFTAAYTFSHTRDNSNGAFSTTGGGGRIFLNSSHQPVLSFNQGNADGDIRNAFIFSSLYELPFGRGRQHMADIPAALDYVIGGWQLNNIVTLNSGTPIDLSVSGTPGNRPDVSGPVKAKITGGKGVLSGTFTLPPSTGGVFTRPGNLGRNAIYGPGYHTWDAGVVKDFKIYERLSTQFRIEGFNLTNTAQYTNGSFNTNVAPTLNTNGAQTRFSSERQVQLALRVSF